jgi:hypothetical protein
VPALQVLPPSAHHRGPQWGTSTKPRSRSLHHNSWRSIISGTVRHR